MPKTMLIGVLNLAIIQVLMASGFKLDGINGRIRHRRFKHRTGMTPDEYRKKHGPSPKRDELRDQRRGQ